MSTINQQSVKTPEGSDNLAVWSANNGDTRRFSLTALAEWIGTQLSFAGRPEEVTQYSAPLADDFSVSVNNTNTDTHLILQLPLGLTGGTIIFPANGVARDKQIVRINTTNQLANLTLDKNGAAGIYGDITSMGADDFASYKYDIVVDAWFRIS